MDDLARIILKHDGIIWGNYVWSMFSGHYSMLMTARFVSLNVFTENSCPKAFLMDLNERFKIMKIKANDIYLYDDETESEIVLALRLHNAVDEMAFIDQTDYTCNAIDYSRSGLVLRKIPACLHLSESPYDDVVSHIKSKTLKIINVKHALKSYSYMSKLGWTMNDEFVRDVYIGPPEIAKTNHLKPVEISECAICKNDIEDNQTCVRTSCLHAFHLECIDQWYSKSPTCPMCREQI